MVEKQEAESIHIAQVACAVAGMIIALSVPTDELWYLYFPVRLVSTILFLGAACELILLRYVFHQRVPIFVVITLLSPILLLPLSFLIQSPLRLPNDRIRIAVTSFSTTSDDFSNRLRITLEQARSRGIPIEVVDVRTTVRGADNKEREAFASRIGKAMPISAHIVVWGNLVADAPPYYSQANITFATNPFKKRVHTFRGSPWLEISSIEGDEHPALWPRTTSRVYSGATLESMIVQQTVAVNELVSFLGGLALLESRQFARTRASIPPTSKSFELRYLRIVALLEQGVEQLATWFEKNGDFILHLPAPDSIVQPLQQAIAELDRLLLPPGIEPIPAADGIAWYAYYARARAKEILLYRRSLVAGNDLVELRDIYSNLLSAAREKSDSVAEMRAFLDFGGYQLQTADSTARLQISSQLFGTLSHLLRRPTVLSRELRAIAYLRLGELCSATPRGVPARDCAFSAYDAAARDFRASSATLGESAVHRARGRYFDRELNDPTSAAVEYARALEIDSRSRYASLGIRIEDAWFYLTNLAAAHQGEIPISIAPEIYQDVVQKTYRDQPIGTRGMGDILLQEFLLELRFRMCDQPHARSECWRDVLKWSNSLLVGFIRLDDPRIAHYHTYRAFALWKLRETERAATNRNIITEMLTALAFNNKAGGVPFVPHRVSRIYREMLTIAKDTTHLDATIMQIVRAQCLTDGSSYLLEGVDSLAQEINVVFPGDSALSPTRCSKTSWADRFTPLNEALPIPILDD
jgi:hypothetical protein